MPPSPLLLLLLSACSPAEPVLSGLTPEAEREQASVREYELPPGVLVDVQYLAGKHWELVRDVVNAQLGDVQRIEDLSGELGTLYALERGEVLTQDGRIYAIRVDLPEPRRRSAALQLLGLPVQVDRWVEGRMDYRLRWVWNFERVRMWKLSPDEEEVVRVEARRWNPRDRQR